MHGHRRPPRITNEEKRIKDRAKGIKFGLTHHDISFRKRKEMEKILHNLELAAVAIDRELKSK